MNPTVDENPLLGKFTCVNAFDSAQTVVDAERNGSYGKMIFSTAFFRINREKLHTLQSGIIPITKRSETQWLSPATIS